MVIAVQRRTFRQLAVLAVTVLIAALCLGSGARPAQAATTTTIAADGTSAGRTFDGIGAISGGGGNTRLLTDYPAAQQQQILDYLFKPGYGADLQILKVEIGGDTNSTDGSESSHMHNATTVDCSTGYEWWLMQQAKARNPAIKLYGLAWGAPGYLGGGNFWSTDTINYLVKWLGCATTHGLTVDYLGGWNERGYNIAWYEQLRTALNSNGYGNVKIVGADSDWGVANDVAANPAFAAAVDIIGVHYPCQGGDGGNADTCPGNATATGTGKPLWASENGSQDLDSGAPALIRSITRGYIDAHFTSYINWPVVAAVYPNLPYSTVGLVRADQPSSGAYSLGRSLWATAQVTQFTAPGWKFLDTGSGYLGGSESNGSFVTLKSTDNTDYSTIIETSTATAAQTVTVHVSGGLSAGAVHVWATDLNSSSPSAQMAQQSAITPSGGSYSLTVQPGYVYTLTTTTGQGKGAAASPAAHPLALPYSDSFDAATVGQQPRYLSQMQGAFEVTGCGGGRTGRCVTQQTPVKPIEWDGDSNPYTIGGDLGWTNYTVATDALIAQAGSVQLIARAGTQHSFGPAGINSYYLQVANTGAWSIVRNNTSHTLTTLASGTVAALGAGSWHHLALTVNGTALTAAIDGVTVGSASDGTFGTGMVGLGTGGYQADQFDNLSVTPVGAQGGATGPVVAVADTSKCVDDDAGGTTNGTRVQLWDCNGGANQNWTFAADGTVRVGGKCLDITGGPTATADGTPVEIWDCNGGANQQWSAQNGALVNPGSGKCLDDPGFNTANGTQLEIWTCNGGSNQQWVAPHP
ncbi:Concanavalin A-like lectin/glucanases superfamily protein [Streptomyces sp. DvalAA-14]|uniref:ricin-type beta-trefoil lectin domain protein n=1 Tax=unclassified Streptomyces TaxID=2593676 RepID=UPI00081B86A8|nr:MULTISPECIES: ricin-type beta-trefoil lectin domain protein [unclassified Streptomyces]MYS19126.1 galactosylceramidase [Streptomyces sp. SID4948]SCD37328.1 Concanavalin A-like lectin/glucanases superfamily protein [Streptomyces sp. DvalAA-14]